MYVSDILCLPARYMLNANMNRVDVINVRVVYFYPDTTQCFCELQPGSKLSTRLIRFKMTGKLDCFDVGWIQGLQG